MFRFVHQNVHKCNVGRKNKSGGLRPHKGDYLDAKNQQILIINYYKVIMPEEYTTKRRSEGIAWISKSLYL